MSTRSDQLIRDYAAAALAAREPMRRCDRVPERGHFLDDDGTRSCYREWETYLRTDSYGELYEERRGRRADADDMADWCPACRHNEDVIKRRIAAGKRRGAILRMMQAHARRLTEASE